MPGRKKNQKKALKMGIKFEQAEKAAAAAQAAAQAAAYAAAANKVFAQRSLHDMPAVLFAELSKAFKRNFASELATNSNGQAKNEMSLEESTSFVPTMARALQKTMPIFATGLMSLFGKFIQSILSLFGVKEEIKTEVNKSFELISPSLTKMFLGAGIQDGDAGKIMANVLGVVQPALLNLFSNVTGTKISAAQTKQLLTVNGRVPSFRI